MHLQASDLKISIKGSASVKHEVREKKEGLEVTYLAPMTGEYRITLSIGSLTVEGSPFRVPCQQPRPCELQSIIALKPNAFVGEKFVARLDCIDQFGNTCVSLRCTLSTFRILEGFF